MMVFKFKEEVSSKEDLLKIEDPEVGDTYLVNENQSVYTYTGQQFLRIEYKSRIPDYELEGIIISLIDQICKYSELYKTDKETYYSWLYTEVGISQDQIDIICKDLEIAFPEPIFENNN